jgi:hypothetical protein
MNAPLASPRVPAERAAPPKDLEIRPKQVKAWIDSLPLAQTVDSARKMCAHLEGLNRAKVPADDRAAILEIYRVHAGTVLEELEAIFGKGAMPLGPRGREALNASRSLASALAVGCRIALSEIGGKLLGFGGKKQQPVLALRAMEFLCAELRASYKAYSPVPQGLWQDMHRLYVFADGEKLAMEPGDAQTKATVHDVYCEALLLSLVDAYRLASGELDKIVAQIRAVRSLPTLGRSRPATKPGGHFIVPCDTDRGPKPMLSASDDTGGRIGACSTRIRRGRCASARRSTSRASSPRRRQRKPTWRSTRASSRCGAIHRNARTAAIPWTRRSPSAWA